MTSPLAPTLAETIARARADLRAGLPITVGNALVASPETLSGERLDALAGPEAILALTRHRAETLRLRPYDGDMARVSLPADPVALRRLADPARDLDAPLSAPVESLRGDSPLLPAARIGIALAKAAHLLPAAIVAPGTADGLTALPATGTVEALASAPSLAPVVSARVPLAAAEISGVHVFRHGDGTEEHYAIRIGSPDPERPVLVRLHSACFTGDVLGSLKCDCGPQLDAAITAMNAEGGILLYLNQEGRGIGLANKMRAYALQDRGFDTVEANHRIGFEDDERDFRLGADLLRAMGVGTVRLLTNNPRKIDTLRAQGIEVSERVPLHVGRTRFNEGYLAVKRAKSGHLS